MNERLPSQTIVIIAPSCHNINPNDKDIMKLPYRKNFVSEKCTQGEMIQL